MIKYQGGTGVQERLTNYPGCEKILKKDLTFRSRTGILAQATLKFSVRHFAGALRALRAPRFIWREAVSTSAFLGAGF